MIAKKLCTLAAGCSLLVGGTATAGIVGITITDVTDEMSGISGYQANWRTFQYHIVFDDPTDELQAVVVAPIDKGGLGPMNLMLNAGTFVHFSAPPFLPKTNFASPKSLATAVPELTWDSYFTFGVSNADGGWDDDLAGTPFFTTAGLGLTWNHGGTSITTVDDDGGIVNIDQSGLDIGMAGHYEGLAVLLLQITVADPDPVHPLKGDVTVAGGGESAVFSLPSLEGEPDPTGACCHGDFECAEDVTEAACDALDGQWHEDEECDVCPLPPDPIGACCHGDFECTEAVTEAVCAGLDGVWHEGEECDFCPVPPPTGACCHDDFTCTEDLTEAACDGLWLEGQTCAACPEPPTGACCLDGFECEILTEADCDDANGVWEGKDTTCDVCPDPPPTGACCLDGFACLENLTLADCTAEGGDWAGAGTTCLADCPQPPDPIGACCHGEFDCTPNITLEQCNGLDGDWQGRNSTCDECPQPPPTGACCLEDFECAENQSFEDCKGMGGDWQGPDTNCLDHCPQPPDPTGACCIDFECFILSEADCFDEGGEYLGDDTTCDDDPCAPPPPPTGACCVDFECSITTEADCAGEYLGDDTTCDGDPCAPPPPPTGACCVDFECSITTEADCAGEWLGADTTCDDDPCAPEPDPTGACCADDSCEITTEADCDHLWLGADTTCDECPVEPPVCGPGAGDCCVSNGTPGCEDVACCELICGMDPFCCDVSWDSLCADQAMDHCAVCMVGDNEGCSIGFWKNHAGKGQGNQPNLWSGFSPDDVFDTVFGVNVFGNATLHQVISSPSGGPNAVHSSSHYVNLGKQAVAALLNAASLHYPLTVQQVIDMVAAAFNSGKVSEIKAVHGELAAMNNLGCPDFNPADLNQDGSVNIYDLLTVLASWGQTHAVADLNGDGVVNRRDLLILLTSWGDTNSPADIIGDGTVGAMDLIELLSVWNQTKAIGDITGDGVVNLHDVLSILANWGPAPARWKP